MSHTDSVRLDQFSASRSREGDRMVVRFTGTADLAALPALGEFLGNVFEETKNQTPKEVAVDLRQLEFMNSSCFKAFVVWLTRISDLDKSAQYQVRFLANASRHWQKRSLAALSCFAADLVHVEM